MPTLPPLLRWARAALLAGLVLAVSAVAHTSAGGSLPGAAALVGLLGAGTLLGRAVLSSRARAGQLLALVVLEQAGLHAIFGLASGTHGHGGSAPMLGAHAVATGAIVLWVRSLERRGWQVVTLLLAAAAARVTSRVAVLRAALAAWSARPPAAPVCAPRLAGPVRLPAERFASVVVRRGPPLRVG